VNKFERQGAILRLVAERELSTQAEVVDALDEVGIEAVQTTVSRDIAQLGLVKARNAEGRLVYKLPGGDHLTRLLVSWRLQPGAAGLAFASDRPAQPACGLLELLLHRAT